MVIAYPHGASFTGEASLELTLHGNPLLVEQVTEDLCARGCRLAEPGEFTRLAFMNDRLALSEAEAVADLISARTQQALHVARRQLSGSLQQSFEHFVRELVNVIAALEAYVDFPEEDLPQEDASGPLKSLIELRANISQLADSQRFKGVLDNGVRLVIVGPPNAGKSSLMNTLLHESRAIVSEVAGTTRDFLEGHMSLGPYAIQLTDTAGLRSTTHDTIEAEGMKRALLKAQDADLLLVVVDGSESRPALPALIEDRVKDGKAIWITNKIDLIGVNRKEPESVGKHHCRVSALTREGLDVLRGTIRERIETLSLLPGMDDQIVNARQAIVLTRSASHLSEAIGCLRQFAATELALVHLRDALNALGEVCGPIDNEAVLDELFANFCIGK